MKVRFVLLITFIAHLEILLAKVSKILAKRPANKLTKVLTLPSIIIKNIRENNSRCNKKGTIVITHAQERNRSITWHAMLAACRFLHDIFSELSRRYCEQNSHQKSTRMCFPSKNSNMVVVNRNDDCLMIGNCFS